MLFKDIINDAKSLIEKESISKNGISKFPTSFSILRYDEQYSKIHQLVLEHLLKAESRIPGGAELVIKLFENFSFKKKNILTVKSTNKTSLRSELQKKFDDKIVNLCFLAVELAGSTGKIFISNTNQEKPILELRTGVRFSSISPTGNFKYESCKFLIIDGFIENVSEINSLLTHAAESKEEILIVCRGLSNDVLNTISVNLKRSTINVRPIIVNFDENGINTLKDISIATNSRLYSSDLGDLISTITMPDNNFCYNVKYTNGILSIDIKKENFSLTEHILSLRERIIESENEAKSNLIKTRLDNLCSRNVVISIPDNIESTKIRQNIDECLRSIKHITMNGVVCDDEKYNLVYDIFESLKGYLDTSHSIYSE